MVLFNYYNNLIKSKDMWYPHVIPARKSEVGGSQSEPGLGKKHKTLFEKQTKDQKDWGVDQVVECLPSKHEAMSSIPSTMG
jgi:hypothetical protein